MKEYIKVTKTYLAEEVSKVNCDKCGKDIDLKIQKERYVNLDFGLRNTFDREINFPHYQLCNDCARVLYTWFNYKWENDEEYKEDMDYHLDKDDDFDED